MSEETGTGPESSVEISHANQLRGARFKALIRNPCFLDLDRRVLHRRSRRRRGGRRPGHRRGHLRHRHPGRAAGRLRDRRQPGRGRLLLCLLRLAWTDPDREAGDRRVHAVARSGDKRRTNEMFQGELAEGVEGALVLFTYTNVSRDSKGRKQESQYPFTLVHIELPEVTEHLPELWIQRELGLNFLDGITDKLRANHERVTLESQALSDRYEIFVRKDQNPVWVRRLFSPSFIVWLSETPPSKFLFQFEEDHLVAFLPRHADDTDGLEKITRLGIQVAGRLKEEVAQTSPKAERETI